MADYYPDISHHHSVDDWERVADHCPFMITKATQGTSFVDSAMAGIVRQCEKRGVYYWLYAYLNKGDELAQAKFLEKTCRDKIGKYFMGYILDVEAGNTAAGVQKAMDYLKTLPHKMMLYTMYSQYDRYKNIIALRPKKCAWWEARYGLNNGRYDAAYPCHSGVDLHQYTSNGTCPGFDERIDLNRITGQGKKEKWFLTPKKKTEDGGKEPPAGESGAGGHPGGTGGASGGGTGTGETGETSGGGTGAGGTGGASGGGTGQEGGESVKYFSTLKNQAVKNIAEFLHNRGFGAGEKNLSKIAAANCQTKEVREALFALARKGRLIKPQGLNKRDVEK